MDDEEDGEFLSYSKIKENSVLKEDSVPALYHCNTLAYSNYIRSNRKSQFFLQKPIVFSGMLRVGQ